MVASVAVFRGAVPRRSPKLLENGQAQIARNCRLTAGDLRPLRAPLLITELTHPGDLQSLYRFADAFWFAWTTDVDCVRGSIPTDTIERTYWTGDGYPKATSSEIATAGGGTNYPNNHYRLGIPVPDNAPSVQIDPAWSGSPPIEENTEEFQVYVYTYVSGWGEEGPPSAPSAELTRARDTAGNLLPVQVTTDTGPLTGAYNIVAKRLYRVNTGTVGEAYQLVAEIPVATATIVETVANDALGVVLPSINWDPPPDDLAGLISLPNGIFAGFTGIDLYLTPANRPHAWPTDFILTVDSPIVGLGSYGSTIVVCTEGRPYLVVGNDPEGMVQVELELRQSCVSKRSIARMGLEGVVYASPDGLVMVGPGGARVISEEWYTREEWQALSPETMIAFEHDRSYIAFFDTGSRRGCIMISPQFDGIVEADIECDGGFVDLKRDRLYILQDGFVYEWDAGGAMTFLWRSGIIRSALTNPSRARIQFRDAAPAEGVTLNVYADGVLVMSELIGDNAELPMPAGYLAEHWELELTGKDTVDEVHVGHLENIR